MVDFLHLSPHEFLLETFRLGQKIYETGFRPKHVISIWRGGTPVGLGVDEVFRRHGVFLNHTTIATESYTGVQEQGEVTVKGLEHVIEVVCREDGLLIVDDVLESGRTIKRILEVLRSRARANAPEDIRVAAVHRKPERATFDQFPVITLKDLPGDLWIDYPHELSDLVDPNDPTDPNIKDKDPEIWELLQQHSRSKGLSGDSSGSSSVGPRGIEGPAVDEQIYLSPRALLFDSIRLGLKLIADVDYHPDFLIALWPGGIGSGLPVHEVYKYAERKGWRPSAPDHISLNTAQTRSSYRSDIVGISYLVDRIEKHHNVLIVDTTYRSGQVVNDVLLKLKEALRRNLSLDRVRVAAVYYNPKDQSTWTHPQAATSPHYYLDQVHQEIIYPQSLHRLRQPEKVLRRENPDLARIVFGR